MKLWTRSLRSAVMAALAACLFTPAHAAGPCEIVLALLKVENQSAAIAGASSDAQARSGARELRAMLDRIDWGATLRLGPVADPRGARLLLRAYAQSRWSMASEVVTMDAARAGAYMNDPSYMARANDLREVAMSMGCIPGPDVNFLNLAGGLKLPTTIAYGALAGVLAVVSLLVSIMAHYKELERRLSGRRNCSIDIDLIIDDHQYSVKMVELGRGGAKIKIGGAAGIAPKRAIRVGFSDRSHPAHIVWSNTHFAGLQFDHALQASEVDRAIKRPDPYVSAEAMPAQAVAVQGKASK